MNRFWIVLSSVLLVSACNSSDDPVFAPNQKDKAEQAGQVEKVDGVPYQCLEKMRQEIIAEYSTLSAEEKELAEELVDQAPVYSCRDRENPALEYASWCDGSACMGATATMKDGACLISDIWDGQDDQDSVDPEDHAKECLVEGDFAESSTSPGR